MLSHVKQELAHTIEGFFKARKFGALAPVEFTGGSKYIGHGTWLCRCDCGNETTVQSHALLSGHQNSCGCHAGRQMKADTSVKLRMGKRYGKLVVVGVAGRTANRQILYQLRCDCGGEINMRLDTLRGKKKLNCGGCGLVRHNPHSKRFSVDLIDSQFEMNRRLVHLPVREARVLKVLHQKYPDVAPFDAIITALWPEQKPTEPRETIKTLISYVRKPLRERGADIVSEWNVGYRLILPAGNRASA